MYYVFTVMGLSLIRNCPQVPMGTLRPRQIISLCAVERQLERNKLNNNTQGGESGVGWEECRYSENMCVLMLISCDNGSVT